MTAAPVVPPAARRSALTVRALSVAYGPRQVLDAVDLDADGGELVAVLGANGSGKSTLLRAVAGLTPSTAGEVRVSGADRRSVPTAVAMVFQQIDLVGRYSALDNVCSGALGRLPLRRSLSRRLFPAELRREAMGCLTAVGLADRAHDPVRRLSGGQQQRVAVARALCQRPDVLLADEPVAALDPSSAEQVMSLLARVAHDTGIAVVAVLHQPETARRHADRIVGLRDGRVVLRCSAATADRDAVDALYVPPGPKP